MSDKSCCSCGGSVKFIMTCSGGSDVGEIADKVSRKLTSEKHGKMFCIAGIGAGISGMIKSAEAAEKNLVIDGCPLSCAKKCMDNAGISSYEYINLSELGMTKGKSEPSDDNVNRIYDIAKEKLF